MQGLRLIPHKTTFRLVGLRRIFFAISLAAIVASAGLSRLLSGLLYGVEPTDPYCFFGSAIVFVGVAALACFLPSRRATAIDPMVALRTN